ncbi:hypothetical protein DFH11DRAFT_1581269 [Phellopilus nigrolimitatus]|nr:hypothetical protein DFH11DRAFT_1581269 [Phellopilus nigrolimitatus]
MHEVHPSHAFLDVPDRPHRSRSEPDLELTNNLNDDGLGNESLTHPNVKCAHCLMDISYGHSRRSLPLRDLRVGGYMFELRSCWLAWEPRC